MAMLPPEIASTWNVPARCSRACDVGRQAGAIANQHGDDNGRRFGVDGADDLARRSRRTRARMAAAISSSAVPRPTISTSSALFTEPNSRMPRSAVRAS